MKNNLVSPQERRWLWAFIIGVMLATSLPYLLGAFMQGGDWRFTGFVFGVEDGNSYIAKMMLGNAGNWLFRSSFSSYPQHGMLAYLPYILLGKLAAPPMLHAKLVIVFHIFRLLAGGMAIWATYDFLAFFLSEISARRWALVVAILGGGLGWVLLAFGQLHWLGSLPLEFYSPETFGFLALFGLPHLALARAALLWSLRWFLERRSVWHVGLLWLLMGLAQPISTVVAWAAVGAGLVFLLGYQIFQKRRGTFSSDLAWRIWLQCAVRAGLISAPIVIYTAWMLFTDPYLSQWTAQNQILSPHPAHYFLAYGLLLPWAFRGAKKLLAERPLDGSLLSGWGVALPILVYAPVGLQRRLAEGIWVVLVVLAFSGMKSWKKSWVLALLLLPSTVILLAGGMMVAAHPSQPAFLPTGQADAFQVLAQIAVPGDVTLGSFETGNALPAWAPLRVIIGHGSESANLPQLRQRVAQAYSQNICEQILLSEFGVRFVFFGPTEKVLTHSGQLQGRCLQIVYRHGNIAIYEIHDSQ